MEKTVNDFQTGDKVYVTTSLINNCIRIIPKFFISFNTLHKTAGNKGDFASLIDGTNLI